MSSLRLALKQSLQEAGPLFKEKKKKTKNNKSNNNNNSALKQKRRPRQPGDPPRKRGRPRKHPRPEDLEHGEGGPDATTSGEHVDEEEEHGSGSEDESASDNEFSYNSDEEEDDSDEEEHEYDEDESHAEDGEVDESAHHEGEEDDPTPVPPAPASQPPKSTEGEDSDEERRRQKKLFKKHLQQAAHKIQAQWKKKAGLVGGSENGDANQGASGDKPSEASPIREREKTSNATTSPNGVEKKKKKDGSKLQTVPPPEAEVLQWNRTLSEKKSRKHVSTGLRVKVRFAAKVKRDGKVVKKKIWYGGRVSAVSKEGSKIRIKYDDGTSEISKFPDKDVVVDDNLNGTHAVAANKFIPPVQMDNVEEEGEDEEFEMDVDVPQSSAGPVEPPTDEPKPKDSTPEAQQKMEGARPDIPPSDAKTGPKEPTLQPRSSAPPSKHESDSNQIDTKAQSKAVVATKESHIEHSSRLQSDFTLPLTKSNETPVAADTSDSVMATGARASTSEEKEVKPKPSKTTSAEGTNVAEKAASVISVTPNPTDVPMTNEAEPLTTASQMTSATPMEYSSNPQSPAKKADENHTEQNCMDSKDTFSPSAPRPHLTIRISKADMEQAAPKTPRVAGSDSDEELFADTPVTERKVKSIKLKGKGKRKRETQEGQPPKKKLNAKRTKLDESEAAELSIPALETSITEESAAENLQPADQTTIEASGIENEDFEKQNTTISNHLIRHDAEEEPSRQKKKERTNSPAPSDFKASVPAQQSPVSSNQHVAIPDSSESQEPKISLTSSPKASKALTSIDEATPEMTAESPLPRSKGSVESLNGMRSGRKAAQQAKEKMNPKQDDKMSEKKKKKRKRKEGEEEADHSDESVDDRQWVQCDSCRKWRILPSDVQVSSLPKHWYCHLNTYDPKRNNCNAPEQSAKQALKEWRKARKRAKQQQLAEMQGVEALETAANEPQIESNKVLSESISPKAIKLAKKLRLEAKRPSPVNMEGAPVSVPDLPRLEKKGKKAKPEQLIEEDAVSEAVPPVPAAETEPPKKPGRKRGRPARNQGNQKETEDKENVEWVQCEKCEKWRKLPPHISANELPDTWYCDMNTWNPESATCSAPEDKADATHHEVSTFAGMFGAGAGKYSYRALIFGNGKKHHRPMSERTRAAESLFMRPIDEVENPYPTVMYSKSSCFLPRMSNFAKANAIEEEPPPSIFDVLSNSEIFAELRSMGQPVKYLGLGSGQPLPKFLTFENLPQDTKHVMREIVLRSLGSGTLSGDELILTVMQFPWESISPDFESIRRYFNADVIINSLLALVRDGVVEMTSFRNFKVPMDQWIPKYRKVRSVRAMQIEESIQKSRCMKISKPWKHRENNSTEWVSGGAAFS